MHTHTHAKPENELLVETIVVSISIVLTVIAFILKNTILNETHPLVFMIFAVAFLLGGFFKAKEGIEETIENKALNVEILMILAAISAFAIGDPGEGALLIMIFAVSGILEGYATNKSKKELTNLLNISPEHATLYKDGEETVVDVSTLKIGDQVIVKVGDSIPVDGKIIRGKSSINEAAITGESMPVEKSVNDQVYAGTFNLSSPVLIEITTSPDDFVVAKIINLVKDAQENQGKKQTFLSKFEKWYVYVVILMAILFFFTPLLNILPLDEALHKGTVVLVVGSPCALVASVAPAMLSSLSNAARKRILIKGAYHLETISGIKAVIFDKTGTITEGMPSVVEFEIDRAYNQKDILDIVYSMEKLSSHPLASAITSYLEDKATYTPSKVTEEAGHGMILQLGKDIYKVGKFNYNHSHLLSPKLITAQEKGYSIVHIILNDQIIGYIALNDNLRPGIQEMIANLKKHGIKSVIVTGDNEKTAQSIAKQAGVDEVIANALPHEKKSHVDAIRAKYGPVLMVGDGLNDAPALAAADIGAAMGTGTDLSIETADVIFMNNNLENIPKLLHLAKANQRIIYQNMIFSISVILLLLVFNVFIDIELPIGVVAHEGSTILVILNSLRMLIKK